MKSLIVSATESEIAPFLSHFSFKNGSNYLNGNQVVVLITGVGMVATGFSMGYVLAKNSFDFALNVGIAGSFNERLALGEVVQVTDDCFAELGAMDGPLFISIDELGFGNAMVAPLRSKTLDGLLSLEKKMKGITVNCVHGSDQEILSIKERLCPDVETMEGAAFFYACNQVGLPSGQVRSISNYVERRDKSKWNIPLAIETLNERLINLYTAIR
jgi:futalosine hydrolase